MADQSDSKVKPKETRVGGRGGAGRGRRGRGNRGRANCGSLMGAGGTCICPKCGNKVPHDAGIPCIEERCPSCGAAMVREGSAHHLELRQREA